MTYADDEEKMSREERIKYRDQMFAERKELRKHRTWVMRRIVALIALAMTYVAGWWLFTQVGPSGLIYGWAGFTALATAFVVVWAVAETQDY